MKRLGKKIIGVALCLSLALSLLAGCGNGSSDAVAVVNGKEILKSTFDKQFKLLEYNYSKQYGDQYLNQESNGKTARQLVKDDLLNSLIEMELMKAYVQSTGYKIDPKEVEQALKSFKDGISSNADFKKFLADNGFTDDYIKAEIENEMYAKEFESAVTKDTKIDDSKLKQLYGTYIVKVNASHILVNKEEEAKDVLAKIKAGESFEALAKKYSKDTASAVNGGNLGYFSRGQMVPEFEKTAFDLEKGKVSEIVKTQYGFHIIKVVDRKTVADLEKDGAKKEELDAYKQSISEQMDKDALTKKLEELKDKADIKKFEDRIK